MSLNQNFTVKNGLNTLGNILSSGTNLTNIFLLSGTAAVNVANAITFNNGGSGGSSGLTFDGSAAKTVSYNTIGASPLAGSSSLTTVGTINSGTWNGNTIGIGYGGTGQTTAQAAIDALVSSTVTSGYVLRGNGSHVVMAALSASDIVSGQALSKTDDTNVTLTLGGASSVALLSAASITAGWTGQLSQSRGGTGNSTGQAASVANAITFNTNGGAIAGTTYNGSAIKTIDYSTVGASPLAGSASLTTVGTIGSGTWNGNTIGIGYGGTGQTTQQAALNALAGAVTNKYYLKGDGTNVAMAAIASADLPATIAANTSGSAATLTTSRNIWGQPFNGSADVTGNLSSVGNITGTAGITISTASNGNITLSPNGTGIVTTAANFQAASGRFTNNVNVGGDLSVSGSLYFGGSAIQLVQGELVINAPIVYLGEDNPTDSLDIGLAGHYVSGSYAHTGLLRSNSTKNWYLFSSMVTEPSANSVSSNTKTIDTLVANTSGSHTGNASTATKLATQRNITSSGDITFTSTSFDGSADITIPTAIGTNKVQYSQIQQVDANSVLGNPTGSTANVQAIGVSTTGFAVLTATSVANGATAVGLGTANSVTFKDVTVSNGTQTKNNNIFYYTGSSNPSTAITTFNNTTYKTAKYVFRINKSAGASASGEILVNYNTGNTTWEGTVYSILDSSNIFTNVDVTATGSTIDLTFTFNGAGTYTVTIIGDAF